MNAGIAATTMQATTVQGIQNRVQSRITRYPQPIHALRAGIMEAALLAAITVHRQVVQALHRGITVQEDHPLRQGVPIREVHQEVIAREVLQEATVQVAHQVVTVLEAHREAIAPVVHQEVIQEEVQVEAVAEAAVHQVEDTDDNHK